jgi:hypothetical protein
MNKNTKETQTYSKCPRKSAWEEPPEPIPSKIKNITKEEIDVNIEPHVVRL